MREYFDVIWAPREVGDYEIRAHFSNHDNPKNLAEGKINLEEIFSLLEYFHHESHVMTFDGCFGTVFKVEIDPIQKKVVLRVRLSAADGTKSE